MGRFYAVLQSALLAISKRFLYFGASVCSVLLPSYSRHTPVKNGTRYVDEEFKSHLWHDGVTELVSVPIVSGAADRWPEDQEDGKRSMMVHPVRQDACFN